MALHELSYFSADDGKIESALRTSDVMLISEAAAEVGLEPMTIRFYERAELVSPEKHGRIRIFRSHDLARLHAIKKLRQFGVPLSVMHSIIKSEGDLTLSTVNSPNVQKILTHYLEEMNRKQRFMQLQITDLKSRLEGAEPTDIERPGEIIPL